MGLRSHPTFALIMSIAATTEIIRRTGNLAGVVDSPKGTVAFWTKSAVPAGSVYVLAIRNAADVAVRGFQVTRGATGAWSIQGRNSADALKLVLTSTVAGTAWQQVLASWDLTAGAGKILINGVDATAAGGTFLSADIDYTRELTTLFNADAPAAAGQYVGDVYDFAFWPGLFVDLTVVAEVAKFISSDGLADYESQGPTATTRKPVAYSSTLGRPAVFFTGAFSHNMGTGGPFQDAAAFGGSTTEPAVYRQSGSPDAHPGERSFDSDKSGFTYPRHKTFVERREGNPDYGLRMGLDERSSRTRDDEPGYKLSYFIFQTREEDDEDDQ